MKRVVLVLCLVAAMAIPTVALPRLAFPPHNAYQGRVEGDPNTYFGFNLNKKKGKVRHLAVALPLNCYSGDHGIVRVHFGKPIEFLRGNGKQAPRRPHRRPRHPHLPAIFTGTARVNTELGRGRLDVLAIIDHRRAEAELYLETDSAAHGHCYSGGLVAKARKGAEVTLPATKP
jgi:hypothetical protein